jgi:predicted permease
VTFWRRIFRAKRDWEADLRDELRFHLEQHTAQNIAAGMPPGEARRQAILRLGGIEALKEECRDQRRGVWLETLWNDLRYGLRVLLKNPGFAAIAIVTLALGIGANTAIFSLADAVLLDTLPVINPHQIVLFSDYPGQGTYSGAQTGRWERYSSENFSYFTAHNESFAEMCAVLGDRIAVRISDPDASAPSTIARVNLVAGNFFSFLGLRAAAGRLFSPDDDQPNAAPVAVLNYAYWAQKFHGDSSIIGKVVEISRSAFTIVGVAPRGFSGVGYGVPDLWLPLASQQAAMVGVRSYAADTHEYWLNIMARLKPGVSLRKAQASVNVQLQQQLIANAGSDNQTAQEITESYIQLSPGAGGISNLRYRYADALRILAFIVGIVLLMACANVANLLVSRSAAREREMCVRLAVGASRARLVRQLLTESVLLAAFGGALGILVGRWTAELLVYFSTGSSTTVRAPLNARMLLFTAAISLVAAILFGLVPALRASSLNPAAPGKRVPGIRARFGLSLANGVVIFQIAASLVFLIGAGLFLRTLQKLADQNLGFDKDHILVVEIDPQADGYKPQQTPALYQALIDRVELVPGVRFATIASSHELSGSSSSSNFAIEGEPDRPAREAMVHKELVGPHYFETQGITILLGRDIGPEDRAGMPMVTVINQTMARKFFPGVNPIGRRFSLGAPFNAAESLSIIGVAADARYYSLRDAVPPMEFGAAFQVPDADSHNAAYARDIDIRTSGDPRALAAGIRGIIPQVASNLRVHSVTLLKEEVDSALRPNLSAAELATGFGALAMLLACSGLYGTIAYRVSRRTQEIGIRMALGSQRSGVLWLVIKEGLLLIAPGLVLGIFAAVASTKIIASQLFGIGYTDPVSFVAVSMLFVLIALAACWIPARRAMRVDPMVALRYE